MPEYLAPGVFIEEVSFRSKSIEGVGTSTTAFTGPTPRGPLFVASDVADPPVAGAPELITSFGEFERLYGGFADLAWDATAGDVATTNYVAHAVRAFFDNGGRRLYFARTFVPGGTSGVAESGAVVGPARFRARFPGSGGNGRVVVRERRSPAAAAAIAAAPIGSLLRAGGGNAAGAARIQGDPITGSTFALRSGQALRLQVGTPPAPATVTLNATPAVVTAQDAIAFPLNLGAPAIVTVTVGERAQTVTVPAGAYAAMADVLAAINPQLRGAWADADGGRVRITTDRAGTGAALAVGQQPGLGFTAPQEDDGEGNVADIDAVTAEELNALFHPQGGPDVPVTVALSGGRLVLVTDATGSDARLQVDDTVADSMHAALGLPTTVANGTPGSTPLYYAKEPGAGWRGGADGTTPLPGGATGLQLVTISLQAIDAEGNAVVYEDVGLHPDHPRWIGTVLAKQPGKRADALANPFWLDLAASEPTALQLRTGLLASLESREFTLTGGNDGVPAGDVSAVPGAVAYADALAALAAVSDIAIVAAPAHAAFPATYEAVQKALIAHAENLRYRFAVLDTPPDQTPGQAREVRGRFDSTRAAIYYPWLMVANPLARPGDSGVAAEIALPPSGFLCGVYARTDVARGVWKAPANEVVQVALRPEREINTATNEVLNPEGVNCIRSFPGRGLRVWGARTASTDPEWKYVSVRRYFIYLERSIDVSTQWAVFEPNGEALWANVRETVSAFLYAEWRNGALLGSKPEEAFFVRCDRSTMTQNDLDNGRLICLVGVAAIKPAEFVIFRIGQKTADARA